MADGLIGLRIGKGSFFDREAVLKRLPPARRKFLARSGGLVRRIARNSIKRKGAARKPPKKFSKTGRITAAFRKWQQEIRRQPHSQAPSPPFTHSGVLRDAILFGFDFAAETVVVGPEGKQVDSVGQLHEYGGERFGHRYPARPFMRPALLKATPKLAEIWAQSFQGG
jgi:hypothetical protein